ncbi:S-adenosylmethionine decarboxylase proenzyme 4-like [Gastrolobium bilobum]|uniref:S-adenosylmethionine decarboxylase proenzyme 4-like n=1 Tax=Gastrolobium bilobum TaxID=150636 RepID=UPI002AB25F8C|nr:S-adenosylmethionine decarboxylase proenzyme 4-like [Gastrolobium bilobum]
MAVSGFEGFEKRLELHFFGDDPTILQLGLRKLDFESIQQTLQAVQCTVVSAVGNSYFDAYVLSESSLFIYPTKIIIKTCGTTQLLKSICPLIYHAQNHLGLTLSSCRYTRGSFIFPNSQPFPHTSFEDEVTYLENTLPPNLCYRKASIMPSKSSSHSWHVFTATSHESDHVPYDDHNETEPYTIEICMTELDPILARKFFRRPGDGKTGDSAGKEMTELTGINEINKDALLCDFAFDPCGYSMNGMDGEWYSTIHVTPEDGYSYASFECVGSMSMNDDIVHVLRKVVQIFRPGTMSVSTTTTCNSSYKNEMWTRVVVGAVEPLGLKCRSCAMDQFPAAGSVVFQTFSGLRRKSAQ